ncbi:hypothetical protein D3C80_1538180 [compost metagenome]
MNRLIRGVGHLEIGHARFADPHALADLLGLEVHRQIADVGVKADQNALVQDLGRRGLGLLHRAVKAGHLTKETIQRHRGEGRTGHAHDHGRTDQRDEVLAVLHWAGSATGASGAGRAGSARCSVAAAAASAALRAWVLR